MNQPKLREWQSHITEIRPGYLSTHGIDQREIIESFSYEEMVFFLLKGRRPSDVERELLRAVIVSHVSHGITGQSTLAVRMAADCRASFLNALIAGFSTGAGIYHQGGLEATMREIQYFAEIPKDDLEDQILGRLQRKERIIGFGHRFHKRSEPRAQVLMEIVDSLQFRGDHIQVMREIERIMLDAKNLPMNIEAAGGSILLDLGIDPEVAHIIIIVGRAPMFAAAYLERLAEKTRPFPKVHVFDEIE